MVCSVLMVIGYSGVRSEAPQEEQEHTEDTRDQERVSSRCEMKSTVAGPQE